MIDYDYKKKLGESVSAVKLKVLFDGLDINKELNLIKDKIGELSGGSDKLVWSPLDRPDVILKLAEGSQIKEVPADLLPVFQPFYEYIIPEPIEFRDIIFYRVQVQKKVSLLTQEDIQEYYPNNNIKIHAAHKSIDKTFLWALLTKYDEVFVIDFCKWSMETGINNSNWGFDENKAPKIFDYGSVRNEKWREIALARDGFYYENGIKEKLPE